MTTLEWCFILMTSTASCACRLPRSVSHQVDGFVTLRTKIARVLTASGHPYAPLPASTQEVS